jgi:hypothetical protein
MGTVIRFRTTRDVPLEDAPRAFVRACPRCRRRKYVTAHFKGKDVVVLICGHCFLMGEVPRYRFTASGRTSRSLTSSERSNGTGKREVSVEIPLKPSRLS